MEEITDPINRHAAFVRRYWWAVLFVFPIFLYLSYNFIWSILEPNGAPDQITFIGITAARPIFHLGTAIVLALLATLIVCVVALRLTSPPAVPAVRVPADAPAVPATPTRLISDIPYPDNPYFTGRATELDSLARTIDGHGRAALAGLGGGGKTQTAVAFAASRRDTYCALLWADADDEDTLLASFGELIRLLNLPLRPDADPPTIVAAVHAWLRDHDDWLLILDNADEPDRAVTFLPPPGHGHLLVTSRAALLPFPEFPRPIPIEPLPPDDALAFLLVRAGRHTPSDTERAAAQDLVIALDRLPLALEQAGAYLAEQAASFADYLTAYRRQAATLELALPGTGDYRRTIATTWGLNVDTLARDYPIAHDLLLFSAFLAPDAIPLSLVRAGVGELGPHLAALDPNDPLAVNAALAPLRRYSLVAIDPDSGTYRLHRLVQRALRDRLKTEERITWLDRTSKALLRAAPDDGADASNWPVLDFLLPHARMVAGQAVTQALTTDSIGSLNRLIGLHLANRIRYSEALSASELALSIFEQVGNREALAVTIQDLAICQVYLGDYGEAERLFDLASTQFEQTSKPTDPRLGIHYSNLGLFLDGLGRYDTAVKRLNQACRILEDAGDLVGLSRALNNLGNVLLRQGLEADAYSLYQRALAMAESRHGPDHPECAGILSNIAALEAGRGDPEVSLSMRQRALAILTETYGPLHPDVTRTRRNLGVFLTTLGRHEDAEAALTRARDEFEQMHAKNHPEVARSIALLAWLRVHQDRHEDAEKLFNHALLLFEQRLTSDHPWVADCRGDFAELYDAMGRPEDAARLRENLPPANPSS